MVLRLGEIIALEEAIDLALNRGWQKICFLNGSKTYIDCVSDNQHNVPWQIYAPLIQIKEKGRSFKSISTMAISKSINGQAQNLAKESLCSCRDFIHFNFNLNAYTNHK